ncbi:electron transfer flavoprotein subunit alpha/FixB family protein [Flavobacteriaceae bacterium]|nr:electron transfer flavoprotein subunit alpha/FixB family protein [Flavobacteriaceae bacterium]
MSILVYAESQNGNFKKSAFEAISYGRALAKESQKKLVVISINASNPKELAKYGPDKIISISNSSMNNYNAQVFADSISEVSKKQGVSILVLSSTADSKYIAPLIAIQLAAGLASNVVNTPISISPLVVKRSCFTNKAFNETKLLGDINIICVSNNSYGIHENQTQPEMVDENAIIKNPKTKVESIDKATGLVSIADADIVISGGRGLKGPENWHLIEELASTLGAATACSKPVSDMGWRPHSEHVGQTGKPVASNLYIAIGVSGAIQHLAGINASKVKVVINNDPEAPFFKAADYGIVADAFDVVPKLTEKLKEFKSQ